MTVFYQATGSCLITRQWSNFVLNYPPQIERSKQITDGPASKCKDIPTFLSNLLGPEITVFMLKNNVIQFNVIINYFMILLNIYLHLNWIDVYIKHTCYVKQHRHLPEEYIYIHIQQLQGRGKITDSNDSNNDGMDSKYLKKIEIEEFYIRYSSLSSYVYDDKINIITR